jgi:uncharacterized membrane protein
MKLIAGAVVLAAVIVSVVALVISHQHGHHCKQQGFVRSC